MNVLKKIGVFSVMVACLVCIQPAAAQFFGNQGKAPAAQERPASQTAGTARPQKGYAVVEPVKGERVVAEEVASPFDKVNGTPSGTRKQPTATAVKNNNNRQALIENKEDTPSIYRQLGHVTLETKDEDEDVQLIFLYMKNFSIYRTPSGQTRCSMRFAIVTTLADKLSTLSCRLKWPKMETTLNFVDVQPDVENHFDYTLLGDGCYNMSRQPNIVVNRCRAKGMNQRTCAGKIRWITESK